MTKTVSARISNKNHDRLRERCNKAGCTMNEWINASIDYLLTGSSDFDFGDDTEEEQKKSEITVSDVSNESKPITDYKIYDDDGKLVYDSTKVPKKPKSIK